MIFSNGDTPETEPESQPHEGAGLVIRIERVPWELIGYGLIFLAALAMRLWDLDGRAYHYDETIHAFDSWSLANGDGYLHSPWSHGPFLYHLSAVAIFIFGDNLASPRLPTVIFGAALVVMPWFLRHRLGMWGALAAAAMLAFSPSLFYFSRFIRNDVLTLVFDLALVISMWRFLETRRNVWLFVAAAALALGFSSKETTFISLGIVGLFLIAWWLADIPSVAHCLRSVAHLLRRVRLAPLAHVLDRIAWRLENIPSVADFLHGVAHYLRRARLAPLAHLVDRIAWWLAAPPSAADCLRRFAHYLRRARLVPLAHLLDRCARRLGGEAVAEPPEVDDLADEAVDTASDADGPETAPYDAEAGEDPRPGEPAVDPNAADAGPDPAGETGETDEARDGPECTPAVGFLIFLIALTLPLFAALPGLLLDQIGLFTTVVIDPSLTAGAVGAPSGAGGYTMAAIIAGVLFVIGAFAGYRWKGKTFLLAWTLFYGVFLLFHTTFLTNMLGFGTGVWQSLGYWLAQQEVERGGQPWYYYFTLLPVYEFLPFFFGVAAALFYMFRGRLGLFAGAFLVLAAAGLAAWGVHALAGGPGVQGKALYLPLVAGAFIVTFLGLRGGDRFEWFLVFWAGFSLLAYIVAGEKMPWLTTHLALPFIILSGKFIGDLIAAVSWERVVRGGAIALLATAPLALVLIYVLTTSLPWEGDAIGFWSFILPLVIAAFAVAAFLYALLILGAARVLPLALLSLALLMSVFTVRAAFQTSYANGDNPDELIVYSQLAPEVGTVSAEIERLAQLNGKEDLRIFADASHAAVGPWRWYLRNFSEVALADLSTYEEDLDHDVILANTSNQGMLEDVEENYGPPLRITFLQWFNPFDVYSNYTPGKFWDDVRSSESWNSGLRYFTYREIATEPSSQEVLVYFHKDLKAPP